MGLHGTVKTSYLELKEAVSNNRLQDHLRFLEQEADNWKHPVSLPLGRRLWLWYHGFTSIEGVLYDFDAHGPEAYLSERQRHRLYDSLNGGQRYLVDDKLSQHWMLADHSECRPTAYGFVDRGYVHGLAGTALDAEPVPVREWLPDAVRTHGAVVLKQLRGLGGDEVHVCRYDDGFVFDAEPVTGAALCETVAGLSGYLATEYVDQHAYADRLYPHAANTLRLLTLWDDARGELIVPIAIQRIGTERSRPVDNWSAGGLSAEVDLDTGELGPATRKPRSGEVTWYETHPDTGNPIEGTTVAHWDRVLATVERLAKDTTNVPAIGWDVLLDEGGDPVVLEANTGTDVDLLQVHRPLLEDSRVAAVVERHSV